MTQPVLTAALAVLAGLVVLLTVALLVVRRRLREATAATAGLTQRLDRLEASAERPERAGTAAAATGPRTGSPSFVITEVGTEPPREVVPFDGRLFTDTLLREVAVKGVGLGHGVRRVLAPEVRHHIRQEMRREVKRARKQRRSDQRDARRAWEAAGRRAAS